MRGGEGVKTSGRTEKGTHSKGSFSGETRQEDSRLVNWERGEGVGEGSSVNERGTITNERGENTASRGKGKTTEGGGGGRLSRKKKKKKKDVTSSGRETF